MIVFSYNDVPFDAMTDAFAGYMTRRDERGEVFDPRTVEQRFDLQGSARIAVPMLIDLDERRMLWTDLNLPPEHQLHSVGGYRGALARLGNDLHAYFGANSRPTLWEVAALHAAARAKRVTIRRRGGTLVMLTREPDEPVEAFFGRVLAGRGASASTLPDDGPAFAALVRADFAVPPGSTLYALYPDDAEGVEQVAAADLAAQLAITSP